MLKDNISWWYPFSLFSQTSVCKKRYKNRQGLSYHTQHTHQTELETSMEENDSQPSPLEPVADPRKHPVKNSMDLEATSVSAVTSASEDSCKSQLRRAREWKREGACPPCNPSLSCKWLNPWHFVVIEICSRLMMPETGMEGGIMLVCPILFLVVVEPLHFCQKNRSILVWCMLS